MTNNTDTVRIYYADDDADDRYLFASALEEINIDVLLSCFKNGFLLEQALTENDYACDIIFLDLNMPKRSGIESLTALQPIIENKGLKIIIFTTSGNPQLVRQTFDLNAALYVQKPNDYAQLVHTLKTVISRIVIYKPPVIYEDFKYKANYGLSSFGD